MKNYYKKIFNTILEKKFSKNMQAGYDPLEVDMFLDSVRNFIIKSNDIMESLEKQIYIKDVEIEEMKKKIISKDKLISFFSSEIDSYKKDGYQSQKIIKELSNLKQQFIELKNGDKDKKK